jgi:DNA replication regulator DPB11
MGVEEERKLIEHRIRSHGGNYHPDLSRQCTHLLCASPTGKKYEAALKWGIQCVDVQWLFQSIDRGMSLEGKYFTLDIDPERRGEGAWDSNAANQSSTFSGLIPPTNDTSTGEFDNGTRKRRLRRAGSKIAQEGIWEGILGGVTDTQTSTLHIPESISTTRVPNGIDLPKSIPEEPAHEGFNMDIDTPAGLFDGMIFYTWGFTDKKVLKTVDFG